MNAITKYFKVQSIYTASYIRPNTQKCLTSRYLLYQSRGYCKEKNKGPIHLICFKQWTKDMVMDVLNSAIGLKVSCPNSHQKRYEVLPNAKVAILHETNEPILSLAVSKAATLMGAFDTVIVENILWDQDYEGKIISLMSDVIFVSSSKHMCLMRFSRQSVVPVLCMQSRTHATLQSLATVMAIMEEFGSMKNINIAYIGTAHPVLNSYLLLCPMLGANIFYKCCTEKKPISPLLMHFSEELVVKSKTVSKQCTCREDAMKSAKVVIAGPASSDPVAIKEFTITEKDFKAKTHKSCIFFHTGPKGSEIGDDIFNHKRSRTFRAFENMHYIAAALMAYTVKGHMFLKGK